MQVFNQMQIENEWLDDYVRLDFADEEGAFILVQPERDLISSQSYPNKAAAVLAIKFGDVVWITTKED